MKKLLLYSTLFFTLSYSIQLNGQSGILTKGDSTIKRNLVIIETIGSEYYDTMTPAPNYGIIERSWDQFLDTEPVGFISYVYLGYPGSGLIDYERINNYYGVNIIPTVIVDGQINGESNAAYGDCDLHTKYSQIINNRMDIPTPISVNIANIVYNSETQTVSFDVITKTFQDLNDTAINLHSVITHFNTNEEYSSSLNGSYEFSVRWSLNNGMGIPITLTTNGQADTSHFEVQLNNFNSEKPYQILAFVQNVQTKEIYNGDKKWLTPLDRNDVIFIVENEITHAPIEKAIIEWNEFKITTNQKGSASISQIANTVLQMKFSHYGYNSITSGISIISDSLYSIKLKRNDDNYLLFENFNYILCGSSLPENWTAICQNLNSIKVYNNALHFLSDTSCTKHSMFLISPVLNLNNASQLTFKIGSFSSSEIAVGYLNNMSDTNTFQSIKIIDIESENHLTMKDYSLSLNQFKEANNITFRYTSNINISIDNIFVIGYPKSNNALLSDLWLSFGYLEPAFNPNITEYTANIPSYETGLPDIFAQTMDTAAKAIINMSTSPPFGSVYVYAENEIDTMLYTIQFNITDINTTKEQQLKLFPNPSNQYININSPHFFKRINIYNLQGKTVFTKTFYTPVNNYSISDIPVGYYLIEVLLNNNNKILSRFVIY